MSDQTQLTLNLYDDLLVVESYYRLIREQIGESTTCNIYIFKSRNKKDKFWLGTRTFIECTHDYLITRKQAKYIFDRHMDVYEFMGCLKDE